MKFDHFVKNCSSYADFAKLLNQQTSKVKGDISEEYFIRFLKWAPWLTDVKGIYNTNDPQSRFLVHQYPELKRLRIGQTNSPVVDIIIVHSTGYSLASAKWYNHGLQFNEIAGIFGLTKQHLPNLKQKYLITQAPRTSKLVEQVFEMGDQVIKILEDEFDVSDDEFVDIVSNKDLKTKKYEKWSWRNKREQESFVKVARNCKNNKKTKFQGPPGWGKTFMMWRMDKYFWRKFGGQTICMADGIIVLKQNFDLYNKQYKAVGIERPSLVICSGAEDQSLIDWPVEVVGQDPIKIAKWLKQNPDGMIFCFYGNTQSLQTAHQSIKGHNFTFGACDEASRTCGEIGSGWSHIVHDSCIKVDFRFFLDATHRYHKKVGMNVKKLYGEMGDAVSQEESEKWGSTTGYFVKGMIFENTKIQKLFHDREFVKGKSYTVEEKCVATKLLQEFAEDPTQEHALQFGLTIKDLNHMKEALEDSRQELIKKNRSKKYMDLKNIEFFVADTHIMTSRDIRDKLEFIYDKKKRSVILTSRLLYRGWSQVKLDCIVFADNFKGVSYIIQALGRGLRKNKDRPDKICKVMIPVDLDKSSPWDHIINLFKRLKEWDYRPIESIINLAKGQRSKAKRKPTSGSVILPIQGHSINANDIRKGLKSVLTNQTNWFEHNIWHELALAYLNKLESFKYIMMDGAYGNNANGWVQQKIMDELCLNDRYDTLIKTYFKKWNGPLPRYLFGHIKNGRNGIKFLPQHTEFFINWDDQKQTNQAKLFNVQLDLYKQFMEIRKIHWMAGPGSANRWIRAYDKAVKTFVKDQVIPTIGSYYPKKTLKRFISELKYFWANGELTGMKGDKQVEILFEECKKYIKEQKFKSVEKLAEIYLEVQLKEWVSIKNAQRFVLAHPSCPPISTRTIGWLNDPRHHYTSPIIEKYRQQRTNPVFTKEQLVCPQCKSKPRKLRVEAERKNTNGAMPYHFTCSPCRYQNKKQKKIKLVA